ncbi:MAG: hypothetical protein JWP84_3873 [Tardiphaga sp.]|nr:hypothetical protein [Tardiphaga sp.]
MSSSTAGVKLRKIAEADLPAVAKLLSEGFPNRSVEYWLKGLRRHAARPRPEGYPVFGFCLESASVPVGAILLLFSSVPAATGPLIRCNVSSWYVKPEFRSFGSLLITSTIRDKNVTYFNITPAPHTWSTVEAQGFSVYCKGQIYAALAMSPAVKHATVGMFSDTAALSAMENDILRQHAEYGCLSLVVQHDGASFPFVFQKHRVKGVVPIYRLIYCRDLDDLVRCAGNIGWFLLKRGGVLVRLDANAAVAGLVGWYSEKRGRKYAKGVNPPRLGDLSFTEAAMFDG